MTKRGGSYLTAGLLLLAFAAALVIFSRRSPEDLTPLSSAKLAKRSANPSFEARVEAAPEDRRVPRDRTWRHAKELPATEEEGEPLVSPVFLGFLQSDPSNTKLRIGLRQEGGEKVDASELVVNVDLLDAQGQKLGVGNEVSTVWQTRDNSFEETPAPVLRVDSREEIAEVSVSLSYKGQRIEQRKYALEER